MLFIILFVLGFLNNVFSNVNSWCIVVDVDSGNVIYNGLLVSCVGGFGNFLVDCSLDNLYVLIDVGII